MIRKKGKFSTFCCALIPGAGQMYLGQIKKGVSIMLCFALTFGICELFYYLEVLLVVLPVIWFYSFFDTINTNGLPDEQFALLEDKIIFDEKVDVSKILMTDKMKWILGGIVLFIGLSQLWGSVYSIFGNWINFNDHIMVLMDNIPRIFIAGLLVLGGIFLISRKKRELQEEVSEVGMVNRGEVVE